MLVRKLCLSNGKFEEAFFFAQSNLAKLSPLDEAEESAGSREEIQVGRVSQYSQNDPGLPDISRYNIPKRGKYTK
jgi:hypothetical protein